ncbi:NUDIX hydrolase [[Leptolyngbya] sp. PCC 7376]|uniref:NUDIX hydrolase n=1 Tax=[Leptolyngbya] sp. PCC 7376 TaxID=111781 RepID=UPI00029F069B|nr:NUDIX hydrolase [[Leptolyngbya] sp. PCC 7376]AFY38358.1 NUDIX hydrolase [[Leptolyngbya] sp. PCC 7376]
MNNSILVAIAILTQGDSVLMQLRDDIPGIIYPGCWGFFGGHLEPSETPEEALEREILEEIAYQIPRTKIQKFGVYSDELQSETLKSVHRHVFQVPLTVFLRDLILNEGWDMRLLNQQAAQDGGAYSEKAKKWRPMPAIHQQILLDFYKQYKE